MKDVLSDSKDMPRPSRGKDLAKDHSTRRWPNLHQDLVPSSAQGSAHSSVFLTSPEEADEPGRVGQCCDWETLVLVPVLP